MKNSISIKIDRAELRKLRKTGRVVVKKNPTCGPNDIVTVKAAFNKKELLAVVCFWPPWRTALKLC